MTDQKVLIFGSFTEDEVKSWPSQPVKNDAEITFGSVDTAILRSVGIFNTGLAEVKNYQPSRVVNKKNAARSLHNVDNTSQLVTTTAVEENGSTYQVYAGHSGNAENLKLRNVEVAKSFRSESVFALPNHLSLEQHITATVTESSTSLDDVSLLNLSEGGEISNSKENNSWASNGAGDTAKHLLPRGLVNLGNLCFLNATLQALLSCAPFVQLLQELRIRDIPKIGYPTLRAFVEFISDFDMPPNSSLRRREMTVGEAGPPVRPVMLESILKCFTPDIPNCLSGRPRQEDAQEFLSFVMHQMHDELLKLDSQVPNGDAGITSLVSSIEEEDDDSWETVGPRNKTAITRTQSFIPSKLSAIFGGQLRSVVKAQGSKASATVQPFLLLHLNICPDLVCTVDDALRLFSAPEALEGYRTLAVGKSQAEAVSASKSVKILELSKIMVLHLMRFSYGSEGSTKLHKPVHFPLELVLGRDLLVSPPSEGRTYELVATITHHGRDPSKGHYTADARQLNGKWLRYDDASVTSIAISKVLHNQAYILFYKRL